MKASPSAVDAASSTRPEALYLRGTGYSFTRNAGVIKGPTGFDRDAGLARTTIIAKDLQRNVGNDLATLVANGATNNNPQYEQLSGISNKLTNIISQCTTNSLFQKSKLRDQFLGRLSAQRDYLVQLESDLEILRSQVISDGRLEARDELLPTDLLVQLFDQNIAYGEFTADFIVGRNANTANFFDDRLKRRIGTNFAFILNPSLTNRGSFPTMATAFDDSEIKNGVIGTNISMATPGLRFYIIDPDAFVARFQAVSCTNNSGFKTDSGLFKRSVDELQQSLFIVDENVFNIVEGLRRNSSNGIFMWDFHHHQVLFYPWSRAIERVFKQVEVAINLTDHVAKEALQELEDELVDSLASSHSELRALSRRYSDLTGRAFNKQLVKPADSDSKPLYVTFILKKLFVKQLGDAESAVVPSTKATKATKDESAPASGINKSSYGNLLAVCRVKNQDNNSGYYPVIYQENFEAPNFVNKDDRVIWGPVAYSGGFHDIHFGIIKSAEDTSGIKEGFKGLLSAVGASNPEMMAFSPGITAMFNAIVDQANKDETELDVQWTLPAEESRDGSDSDNSIAETGIYIVIKTENGRREGIDVKSAAKLFRRMLVYNPEDKKLYWRRTFTDPKRNFENSNNVYRDKTYAVFALVDDYQAPDNIAEVLRKDLSQALPQSKVDALIPTPSKHAEQVVSMFSSMTNVFGAPGHGTNLQSQAKISNWVNSAQRTLWGNADPKDKQLLLKLLSDRADGPTRTELGEDLDRWRKTPLQVNAQGEITLNRSPFAQTNAVSNP